MATKKISELTSLVTPANDDVLPIVDTSETDTKKITSANLKTYVTTDLVTTIKNDLIDAIYPVGSIYMTISSTNPGTTFGRGTWVAWGSGRVPVGVDTGQTEFDMVEKTGGHKLLQAHNHLIKGQYPFVSGSAEWVVQPCSSATPSQTSNTAIASTGGGDSQNLQPYITCYMWKRTA